MPAWRRKVVTASANCAGFIMVMMGFRMRVRGWENFAKAKELGAVSSHRDLHHELNPCIAWGLLQRQQDCAEPVQCTQCQGENTRSGCMKNADIALTLAL